MPEGSWILSAQGIMAFIHLPSFLLSGLQPGGRLRGVQEHRREGARPVIIMMMLVGVTNRPRDFSCLVDRYSVSRLLGPRIGVFIQ